MNIRLPHPIERIRGGDIIVTVECSQGDKTVSNFSIATDDKESSIQEAMERAIEKCKTDLKVEDNLPEAIIAIYEDAILKSHKPDPDGALDAETMKILYGPCDEHKQKELSGLCETLGISKINAITREYNMIQTLAVIAGLKKWAKSMESKA